MKEKHKANIGKLQVRHLKNVANQAEKMQIHKEFVAKSLERREK